jgi:hypothetical protein
MNVLFSFSILIDAQSTSQKAEASMDRLLDGVTIDRSDENENAFDAIRVDRECDSNEMDESD